MDEWQPKPERAYSKLGIGLPKEMTCLQKPDITVVMVEGINLFHQHENDSFTCRGTLVFKDSDI